MCKEEKKIEKKKYVNGYINLDLIPKNIYNSFIISLKMQIYEYYNKNNNDQLP